MTPNPKFRGRRSHHFIFDLSSIGGGLDQVGALFRILLGSQN
ncbi:MAG: hypothetical protein ACUVQ1_08930 [Candidatus Kapaibacteriales bacterium]